MICLDGTSGFHYGQVVLVIHLSIGQVEFLTTFEPWVVCHSVTCLCLSVDEVLISFYLWRA